MTSRETLARQLTRARDRTLRLVEFDDAELSRQYSPLMSPLVWDLAHIGQQEDLWLLRGRQRRPRRAAAARGRARSTTRSSIRAPPGRPAAAAARRGPRVLRGPSAAGRSTASTRCPTTTDRDLRVRAGDQPRAAARRDHAAGAQPADRSGAAGHGVARCPRRPAGAWPAHRCWCPAARSCWVSTRSPNRTRWTTSVPPTSSTCRPSGSAGSRSPTPNGGSSSTTAATPSRGGGRIAAGQHRQEAGLEAPQFWNHGTAGTRTRFGHIEDIPADEPVQHVTSSRPRRTRRGQARGCPPRRSGRRPAHGIRGPARAAASRGAHRSPPNTLANLGGDALRPAPVGAYPAGASAYGAEQMLGDVWEWTTSPLRPWPGFTPMIYARYCAAVLRRRLQGAARRILGGRAQHPAAQLPQLGPSDPAADLLRSAAGLADGRRLMCRHLGWLGEPRSVSSLVLEPPSGLLVQSYAPRRQKHGLMNADGWGVGFFDHGVVRRWRSAAPAVGRRVVRLGGARPAQRLRRRRGALGQRRHADRAVGVRAVHRRPVAAVPQRPGRPRRAAALGGRRIDRRQRAAGGADLRPRTRRRWATPSPRSPPPIPTPG